MHSCSRIIPALALALALAFGSATGAESLPKSVPDAETPKSVDSAVSYLLKELPESQKAELRGMKESDLVLTHFGLGLWIRNNFPVNGGSPLSRDACSGRDIVCGPEAVSSTIVREVWKRLRAEG